MAGARRPPLQSRPILRTSGAILQLIESAFVASRGTTTTTTTTTTIPYHQNHRQLVISSSDFDKSLHLNALLVACQYLEDHLYRISTDCGNNSWHHLHHQPSTPSAEQHSVLPSSIFLTISNYFQIFFFNHTQCKHGYWFVKLRSRIPEKQGTFLFLFMTYITHVGRRKT